MTPVPSPGAFASGPERHGRTADTTCWKLLIIGFAWNYHLVMTNIAMERSTIFKHGTITTILGPTTSLKIAPSPSILILCCMLSTYTSPKPLHPFYTGLYVANLQGLKPPQSRYILLLYYAVVVNLHHPKATTSLLYWAVCCQSTGPEATPKPLHSSCILCCMLSTYTTPKPLHPFDTGLYVANLQGLKPPYTTPYVVNLHQPKATTSLLYWAVCCQSTGPEATPKPLHSSSIPCCMLSTYTSPKPLHPFYTGLYVANLQGLKPPQSRYILLLYYAVCCQPTPAQSHYIPSILGCMLPIYRA